MPKAPGQNRLVSVNDRFRHDAMRDTMWLGKGVKAPWLVVAGIVVAAFFAVQFLGR